MNAEIASNLDSYGRLTANMTESERSAFATGLLIGSTEMAKAIIKTIDSDLTSEAKLDTIKKSR